MRYLPGLPHWSDCSSQAADQAQLILNKTYVTESRGAFSRGDNGTSTPRIGMNQAALVETLRPLPRPGRVRLAAQIDRLQRICGNDQPLEAFLGEVLDVLRRVFGAAAAAFWFRPHGSDELLPSVRIGFSELPFASLSTKPLDQPVIERWQSNAPSIESLADLPATVLVGPIHSSGQPLGAVQLVIAGEGEAPREIRADDLALYQHAILSVLAAIQPALIQRTRIRSVSIHEADDGLERLGQQINGIQRSIRLAIEQFLHQHRGATFGSFEANQRFVRSVQKLLESYGLRVRCAECGHPAILRCARNTSAPSGLFVFDHYLPGGRTFHGGGRVLPVLRVTAKPARRKSSSPPLPR